MGNVVFPQLPPATQWVWEGTYFTNGETTFYTTPPEKTLWILMASIIITHYAAGYHTGEIRIYDDTGGMKTRLLPIGCSDAEDSRGNTVGFPLPIGVPSGWTVRLFANPYTTAYAHIIGWLE